MDWDEKYAYQVPGKLEIPYKYMAGKTGSKFLVALRDEGKLLATVCPHCEVTYMPPRSVCNRCYRRISEWKEVGPRGEVVSFTVVRYSDQHLPQKPPFILALIKLSGADTAFVHRVSEIEPEKMKTGLVVEPVFAVEREGRITDIEYFRPVS